MRPRRFSWIDAFTNRRFGGNPCVVVFDAGDVSEADRIAFTRETGLSECAFLQPSDQADFGVRYYLASREIKMAGHPTIATVAALLDAGMVAAPSRFSLEVGAGPIDVTVATDPTGGPARIVFATPTPSFGRTHDPAAIAALYGLSAADVIGTPQTVDVGGTRFCVTLLTDKDALRRAALDVAALGAIKATPDCDFFEPFLATLGGDTPAGDTFSRLLMAPPEPPEDPFTGSATACLAAYLWRTQALALSAERPNFMAEQGHWLGRPGSAEARIVLDGDVLRSVEIGGQGVVVMRGDVPL